MPPTCCTPTDRFRLLQVFFHQRMLRQATGAINGPLASSINDASSLYNISGVWVGIGDQYDAGALVLQPCTHFGCIAAPSHCIGMNVLQGQPPG